MKKISSIIAVALSLTLLVTACGAQQSSGSSDASVANRKQVEEPEYQAKLDLIQPTAYNNVEGLDLEAGTYISVLGKRSDGTYWKEIQRGVEQAAEDLNKELGYEGKDKVKVTFNAPSTADDVDEQVNILDEELARYPLALAISIVDVKACEVQFDLATESGIPIVAFDSGSDYQGLMAMVSTDNEAAANEAAEHLAESMGESGEVIVFAHDSKSLSSLNRVDAFTKTLTDNYPNMQVVETYSLDQLDDMRQVVADEINAGNYRLEDGHVVAVNTEVGETTASQETAGQTAASQETGSQEAAGQTVASQETGSETTAGQTADSQETGSETAASQETGSEMDSAAEENSTASDAEKVLAEDITEAQVVDYLFAKHPNVEGCFATNSEAMELVLTETEDLAETKDLHMVGFDVTDTVLEAVQDGRIDGLIVQNPFGMGYAAVVASARAALNMGNEANVDTGYTWVSSENLEDDSVQQILY